MMRYGPRRMIFYVTRQMTASRKIGRRFLALLAGPRDVMPELEPLRGQRFDSSLDLLWRVWSRDGWDDLGDGENIPVLGRAPFLAGKYMLGSACSKNIGSGAQALCGKRKEKRGGKKKTVLGKNVTTGNRRGTCRGFHIVGNRYGRGGRHFHNPVSFLGWVAVCLLGSWEPGFRGPLFRA